MPVIKSNVSQGNWTSLGGGNTGSTGGGNIYNPGGQGIYNPDGTLALDPNSTYWDDVNPYDPDQKAAEQGWFQDTVSKYFSDNEWRQFKDYYDTITAVSNKPGWVTSMDDVVKNINSTANTYTGRASTADQSGSAENELFTNPEDEPPPVDIFANAPAADGDYSKSDIDAIVALINSGTATVDQVADFYSVDPSVVQENLNYINRTHHDTGTAGTDT